MKEDEHSKQSMEKFFTSMEKRFIRNGRLCEVLDDEIGNIHGLEVTDSLCWVKVCYENTSISNPRYLSHFSLCSLLSLDVLFAIQYFHVNVLGHCAWHITT